MKSRWLAYVLLGAVSFGLACKGGDGGGSFLEIIEFFPENGREDVQVEVRIAVRLSDRIDPATLTSETFFLTDEDGAVVPSTVTILDEPNAEPSQRGTAAELKPVAPLAVITNFTVTVTTDLMSTGGLTLEEDFEWRFKTLDAEWGESEWIEPLGPGTSSTQEIAIDEQLNAIAVWEIDDGVGTSIVANRYTRTDLWGEPEPIDDGNGDATNPQLAVDGAGNGFAVWVRTEAGTTNIWTTRYDAEQGSWDTPALLQNGDVTRARDPSVAADRLGNAVAVWVQIDLDTGREVIRAIRYEPGTGWGDAVTIGVPGTFIAAGSTAVGMDDDGNAIAVWDPPAGLLWANHYTPGSDWGGAVPIKSDGTTSADGFRLDVGANGDAFVIWVQDNGDEMEPRNDIWSARFAGGVWSDPGRIDRHDGGDKSAPDIAVDGAGVAYAVWSQIDPAFANIWAAQYTPDTPGLWGIPELIEPENPDPNEDGDATVPRVEVNRAGNAFVVWRQIWDSWGSVWSNRRDPLDTTWRTAERIEDIPETAFLPTIAVDEARHAHALWLHSESDTNKLRTSRFE
ncbi:MAG: Ig-like domain-containing protein [Myxococcales bacterium]|nr:Ig-like domain-containing protein [Myxococcales bacterium]MDH3485846.1 Ig-like domain-containing protein [Myxococcales bacterium]